MSRRGERTGRTTAAYDDQFVFSEKLGLRGGRGGHQQQHVSGERRAGTAPGGGGGRRTLDIVEGKYDVERTKRSRVVEEDDVYNERRRGGPRWGVVVPAWCRCAAVLLGVRLVLQTATSTSVRLYGCCTGAREIRSKVEYNDLR